MYTENDLIGIPRYQKNNYLFENVALFLFITIIPFQWVVLIQILGLKVKPVHLSFIMIVLAFLNLNHKGIVFNKLTKVNGYFIYFFSLYLAMLIFAMLGSDNLNAGISVISKFTIYFVIFILLSTIIMALPDEKIARLIYLAVPLGIFFFIGYAVYVFHTVGKNFLVEYILAVRHADVGTLHYKIYPMLFNFSGGTISGKESDSFMGSSLRNMLMGVFITYMIILNMYGRCLQTQRNKGLILTISIGLTILFVLIVLSSVSRSAILILCCCFGLVWFISKLRLRKRFSLKKALGTVLFFMVIIISTLVYSEYFFGAQEILHDRFTDMGSTQSRIIMYQESLKLINEKMILGHGPGARIETTPGRSIWEKDHRVHNLFFASWFEAGTGGLIASILFYFAIVWLWIRYIILIINYPNRWLLPISPEWTMTLPIVPLFRALLSGGGGMFALVGWFCLAMFFACIARNEAALRASDKSLKH